MSTCTLCSVNYATKHTLRKLASNWLATALASNVLPVPTKEQYAIKLKHCIVPNLLQGLLYQMKATCRSKIITDRKVCKVCWGWVCFKQAVEIASCLKKGEISLFKMSSGMFYPEEACYSISKYQTQNWK